MPMPIAALRDPATETPPADSLGYAVTGLGHQPQAGDLAVTGPTLPNVNDIRAILIDGAPVRG